MRTRRRLFPLLAALCLALPHGVSSQSTAAQPASSTATPLRDTALTARRVARAQDTRVAERVASVALGTLLVASVIALLWARRQLARLEDRRPPDSVIRVSGIARDVTMVAALGLGVLLLVGRADVSSLWRDVQPVASSAVAAPTPIRVAVDSVHAAALPPLAALDASGRGFVFAVAGVLVVGAAACFALFVDAARSDRPLVEGHWGGFGGGASGWRVSPAVLFLVGLLALGAMLTAVATAALRPAAGSATATPTATPAKGE